MVNQLGVMEKTVPASSVPPPCASASVSVLAAQSVTLAVSFNSPRAFPAAVHPYAVAQGISTGTARRIW